MLARAFSKPSLARSARFMGSSCPASATTFFIVSWKISACRRPRRCQPSKAILFASARAWMFFRSRSTRAAKSTPGSRNWLISLVKSKNGVSRAVPFSVGLLSLDTALGLLSLDTVPCSLGLLSLNTVPCSVGLLSVDTAPFFLRLLPLGTVSFFVRLLSLDTVPFFFRLLSLDTVPFFFRLLSLDTVPFFFRLLSLDMMFPLFGLVERPRALVV